jgi:hypothetical protein
MSSGFDSDDIDSFFELDGVAVVALITGPAVVSPAVQFTRTINAVFDEKSEAVALYGDTDVEAPDPVFECKSTDLAGVKRGMGVTFPEVAAHEEGYGNSYKVERIAAAGVQTSKVYLKEL